MEKIITSYEKEIADIKKRLDDANMDNKNKHQQLIELESQYEKAVLNSDENATGIKEEIKELSISASDSDKEVNILEKNYNVIAEKAANKAVKEIAKKYKKYEAEKEKLEKKLFRAKQEYVNLVAGAQSELIDKVLELKNAGSAIVDQADNELIEELELITLTKERRRGWNIDGFHAPFLLSSDDIYQNIREMGKQTV
jgi:predicted  nucleic acid-binding Zn-ribbon protein